MNCASGFIALYFLDEFHTFRSAFDVFGYRYQSSKRWIVDESGDSYDNRIYTRIFYGVWYFVFGGIYYLTCLKCYIKKVLDVWPIFYIWTIKFTCWFAITLINLTKSSNTWIKIRILTISWQILKLVLQAKSSLLIKPISHWINMSINNIVEKEILDLLFPRSKWKTCDLKLDEATSDTQIKRFKIY